jgi:two-component system CheB/CheR fusion protein
MGSDGTLGLRAIKDHAGATFVQSPSSAKFDSMPCNAINAGLADVIAPAEDLLKEIMNFHEHSPCLDINTDINTKDTDLNHLEKLLGFIRTRTSHDFSLYKKPTISRRVERRMALHQLLKISDYVSYIRANPSETDLLFKELLIGVTSFFRDTEVWEHLKTDVIPDLLSKYPAGRTLRAWVTACSTGEEAYRLAMAIAKALCCCLSNRFIFASLLTKAFVIFKSPCLVAYQSECRPCTS